MNQCSLIARRIKFYSLDDEDLFFWWIEKIACIEKYEAAHDELYLDLRDGPLSADDIRELVALCVRYKIDIKQLASLMHEDNKEAFSSWEKKIVGSFLKKTRKNEKK